ncbi:methyl-CpG-binding domain protein 6 [Microcaecilia unicolor]|uniref:Protein MENT n=1 Tax=Microcaecilia unicolor TaxID=1415580 RepID=A0A6P7WQU4_9AMPH|nr:protein MENT [Microcaecilia unicolor]
MARRSRCEDPEELHYQDTDSDVTDQRENRVKVKWPPAEDERLKKLVKQRVLHPEGPWTKEEDQRAPPSLGASPPQAPPSMESSSSPQAPPSGTSPSPQALPSLGASVLPQAPSSMGASQATSSMEASPSLQTLPSLEVPSSPQAPPSLEASSSPQAPPSLEASSSPQGPPSLELSSFPQGPPSMEAFPSPQAQPSMASPQAPPSMEASPSPQSPLSMEGSQSSSLVASAEVPPSFPSNDTSLASQAPFSMLVSPSSQALPSMVFALSSAVPAILPSPLPPVMAPVVSFPSSPVMSYSGPTSTVTSLPFSSLGIHPVTVITTSSITSNNPISESEEDKLSGGISLEDRAYIWQAWSKWYCNCPAGSMSRVRDIAYRVPGIRLTRTDFTRRHFQRVPCNYKECHCNHQKKECEKAMMPCQDLEQYKCAMKDVGYDQQVQSHAFWSQIEGGMRSVWQNLGGAFPKDVKTPAAVKGGLSTLRIYTPRTLQGPFYHNVVTGLLRFRHIKRGKQNTEKVAEDKTRLNCWRAMSKLWASVFNIH